MIVETVFCICDILSHIGSLEEDVVRDGHPYFLPPESSKIVNLG